MTRVRACGGGSWDRHAERKDVRLSAGNFKTGDAEYRGGEKETFFTMRTPE